jgi:hypothetical protein
MAARDCEISTESEDAEDFAEDRWQDASKRCIPEVIGTMNLKSWARCPSAEGVFVWEMVETWDHEVLEDGHIRDCILNNEQQFMRGAGLSFVAGQKKKPTNLYCFGRYGAKGSTRTKSLR